MKILGIDPGTKESGWCICYSDGNIDACGVSPNEQLIYGLATMSADILAVEVFEARGMPIGNESIETILFTGALLHEWESKIGKAIRIKRSQVKLYLCGSSRARTPT